MPNKWSDDDEINLINMLKEKKSIKEIDRKLDRSDNAIEQRINKIVYENIKSGKTEESIAKSLKISVEDIKSYYENRKLFLEQKLKGVAKEVGISVADKKNTSSETKESEIQTEINNALQCGKRVVNGIIAHMCAAR